MELYNEEDFKRVEKGTKLPSLLKIIIVLLTIILIVIIGLIIYIKSTITKITLNGENFRELEKMMVVEDNEIYIPIKKIAPYLQYEAYTGDYTNKSEDKTKCYITTEFETVQFMIDSSIIIKIPKSSTERQNIQIDNNIIQINDELYTTIDGIEKAYNVEFIYNKEENYIKIYTMDYLVEYYGEKLTNIEKYSTKFEDKKAIFKNLMIVEQNKKYGILNLTTGEMMLETKYDDIEYISATSEFLIKTNSKCGIISEQAEVKVKTVYDELKLIDSENGLYLAKENGLYGVITNTGNVVIKLEYNQVGIPGYFSFAKNGIESQYVILDELIPVKKNDRWGFFNTNGDLITECKYYGIGSTNAKIENTYPVLVIPSHKLIVVKEENTYNIIGIDGIEKVPANVLEQIYLKNDIVTGENTYFMSYNGKSADIEEWITSIE